jgi:hypothetical protein
MVDEHPTIRDLKHRWDEEDKAREELERQAKRAFLEQEANELFAPLENYLTTLDKALHGAESSIEVDTTWEHIGDQKLRRMARVRFKESVEMPLDFTVEGATIIYRKKTYRFTRAVEELIPAITSDVEQFITAQRRTRGFGTLPSISRIESG